MQHSLASWREAQSNLHDVRHVFSWEQQERLFDDRAIPSHGDHSRAFIMLTMPNLLALYHVFSQSRIWLRWKYTKSVFAMNADFHHAPYGAMQMRTIGKSGQKIHKQFSKTLANYDVGKENSKTHLGNIRFRQRFVRHELDNTACHIGHISCYQPVQFGHDIAVMSHTQSPLNSLDQLISSQSRVCTL